MRGPPRRTSSGAKSKCGQPAAGGIFRRSHWGRASRSGWSVRADRTLKAVKIARGETRPERFVCHMPKWVPIELFNTGKGLKEGEPDPHWQLVARSDDPHFKPRPAMVSRVGKELWLANEPARSQWISLAGDASALPDNVTYTFRTTFKLVGVTPGSAVLRVRFIADNQVQAIRLNGREISVPDNDSQPPFTLFQPFSVREGFVEGTTRWSSTCTTENSGRRRPPLWPA